MNELMSPTEELLAREHIKEAKYKYFRALDFKDFALLREALTDDVYINYGPMGQFRGLEAFLETVQPMNTEKDAGFDTARGIHHALNPEIAFLDNGEAECRWFTHFTGYDNHRNTYLQQSGNYVDRYRKEQGAWKICESNYTLWFHQGSSMGAWTPLFPDGPVN